MDWVPISAALLLTGALALCLGSFLLPQAEDSSDSLRVVIEQDNRWLAVAVIFFLGSVFLTLGLPSALTLFERRGRILGLAGAVALEVGFIGTAGFAMLMVFFRSLVKEDALRAGALDAAASETGLAVFLAIWVGGFYLGELLLGIGLLRARSTPPWVPVALIVHAAAVLFSELLPEYLSKGLVLLLVAGFAGIAIQATSPEVRRRFA